RDEALLRESAVHHFAHQASLTVERIHRHTLADLPAVDARSDFQNLACHVETDDDGQRHLDAGHTSDSEHVVVIKGCRLHANHDVVVRHDGIRKVRHELEIVETSLLFQDYGFHNVMT